MRAALVFASHRDRGGAPRLHAQDLAPRAYTITPRGSNAFTLANAYNDGPLLLEGAVPIEDATARLNAPSLTYYRAFSLLGRSANVIAGVAYGVGNFEGTVLGEQESIYRSGLFDSVVRLSVNLVGGPAMSLRRDEEVAAEDPAGSQPQGGRAHGPVRSHEAHQPRRQPLGVQARAGPVSTLGPLAARRVRRRVALHREPGVLLAQRVLPGRSGADPGPGRRPRDPPQLRLPPAAVGVARRQLLAWRHDEPERGREPGDAAAELARGDHGILPRDASPVSEAQLRRGAYIRFGGDYQVLSAAWQYSWISAGGSKPSTATASSHSSSRQE